jgi:ferredoxin-NADP reductase
VPYPTRGNQTGWDAIPALFTPGPRRGDGGPTVVAPAVSAPATLELEVTGVRPAAGDVVAVTLARPDGAPLPGWAPGAHVELRLPSGRLRQYSLCGDPADPGWRIAVLREPEGRGGSVELHEAARPGARFTVRGPRNHFALVDAPDYLLLAGGIGVTPLLAMAREIVARGAGLRVLYGGRTAASMAFADELSALGGDRVQLLPQDVAGLPDLAAAVAEAGPGTAIYCCGPAPMIAAAERVCATAGVADRLHVERFTAPPDGPVFDPAANVGFDVVLARSGATVRVPADRRLIEVVRHRAPGLSYDCEQGYCGACETRVLGGVPEHRDTVLTEDERASGRTMMICVGRSRTPSLTLDL